MALGVLALSACAGPTQILSPVEQTSGLSREGAVANLATYKVASATSPNMRDVQRSEPNLPGLRILNPQELAAFNLAHPRNLPLQLDSRFAMPASASTTVHNNAGYEYNEYPGCEELDGLLANNSFYGGYQIYQDLFAPTMKAPRGCLEASNQYYNDSQWFAVYDFCDNGGTYVVVEQVNASFYSRFVRELNGSSVQQITDYSISYGPGQAPAAAGKCNKTSQCDAVAIYNYETNAFDVQWSRIEGGAGAYAEVGWINFEYYFFTGYCPTIPTMESTDIEVWEDAKDGFVAPNNYSFDNGQGVSNSCFPSPYTIDPVSPTSWTVNG